MDPEYGFVNDNNEICINIQRIWEENGGSICGFITDFAMTHTHEFLHILLPEMLGKQGALVWEEKVIRKLTGDKWNKKLEQLYIEDEEE